MKNVILLFRNIPDLLHFLEATENNYAEINIHHFTITCELSEHDIDVARNNYGATLVYEACHASTEIR